MTKRAVLYARVSGDDKGNEGRNLKGQIEMCRKFAIEKGWIITAELSEDDRGASGASFDLPELNRALQMARNGEFDVLVTRELDRFAREMAKQLIVEREFKQAKVQIEYVLGDYPDTPEGRLMKNVRATIAEYEREKIRERIVRGRKLKVKSGQVIIPKGQAPYGYRILIVDNKRTLEIVEIEAERIRLIFTWYVIGDESGKPLSIGKIARKLSELKVPSFSDVRQKSPSKKKRGRGSWGRSSVANILKNETYAGTWWYGKRERVVETDETVSRKMTPRKDWIGVPVPAIISREIWEAAQERLKTNMKYSKRNTKHNYLLRRRTTCGRCGRKMGSRMNSVWGKWGHVAYYFCPSHDKTLSHRSCGAKQFRSDYVDFVVWEWLKTYLLNPEKLTKGLSEYKSSRVESLRPLQERLKVVKDLVIEKRAELEKLLDLYLSDIFDKEILVGRKHNLETQINKLEQEEAALTSKLNARNLSEADIVSLQSLAQEIAFGLASTDADADFDIKRQIVDNLDVQVTLDRKDEEIQVDILCKIGKKLLSFIGNPIVIIVLYAAVRIRTGCI